MYIQFQSLTMDPKCSIKIAKDEDFKDYILNTNINKFQYDKGISLSKEQEYYFELTLDKESKKNIDFLLMLLFLSLILMLWRQ